MQRIRTEPRARLAGAAAGLAWIALTAAAAAAPAEAAPRLLSLRLDRPAVSHRPVAVGVRAVDPDAPVSGAVVSFGRRAGAFGLSACRRSSSRRAPRGPFAPGSAVRLSVPHTFAGTSSRKAALRVDTGGCAALGGSLLQRFTVTPVRRGTPPKPVARERSETLPSESKGGAGVLGLPSLPDLPGKQLLPQLPLPLPLPGLWAAAATPPTAALARSRRRCAGAGSAVRRAARARQKARGVLLCLINVERRARGLRRLRASRRLTRAAAAHSRAMVRRRFFSHVAPGGADLVDRLRRVGYLRRARSWMVGENIGFGGGRESAPLRQMRAWMRSSAHRANILEPRWREIGLGVAAGMPNGSRRGATYTSDFGVRRR